MRKENKLANTKITRPGSFRNNKCPFTYAVQAYTVLGNAYNIHTKHKVLAQF